ncbi:flavin reductase family protein [Fusobacterium polymorphum]|uniref:flavin reductase family protein n=1 Tax=Fusobacterium nucleatum subsp. polymorphum TaxID=76857 RepID=UPI00300AACE6
MRKNFSKKTVLLPLPVYIIGTYDENGKANAMNLAWGVQCGYHEVSLSIAREHKTMENILLKKAFTISLATKSTKDIADYFGIVSGNKVDKIEKSGVHIVKSKNIDAPIIEEFPLTLECKVIDIQEELGDYRVVAEIINTLADERVLNEKGEIDVDKLELITFDSITNSYHILGEKVGQAFKDGAKIK